MLNSWVLDTVNAAFTGMAFSLTTAPPTTLSLSYPTAIHTRPVPFLLRIGL
jgi:hypothetical protein